MDLIIKGTISIPGTKWRHAQQLEWDDLDPIAAAAFIAKLKEQAAHATHSANKGGPFTAKLECTVDGVVQDPLEVPGVKYEAYEKFLDEAEKFGKKMREHSKKKHGGK